MPLSRFAKLKSRRIVRDDFLIFYQPELQHRSLFGRCPHHCQPILFLLSAYSNSVQGGCAQRLCLRSGRM
jgi:hypothetical protein